MKDAAAKYMAEGMSAEEAYRRAYAKHAETKLADADNLSARERYELEQRQNRLNNQPDSSNPTLEVSRSQYPNHVAMLENAQKEGHSLNDLERGGGTKEAKKNRYESQKEIR